MRNPARSGHGTRRRAGKTTPAARAARTVVLDHPANRKTAAAYEDLLVNLLVLERPPAWTSNRLSRLVKTPKRYVVGPALVAATLGLDLPGILRDGDLMGRLLDTFVAAQIRRSSCSARAARACITCASREDARGS